MRTINASPSPANVTSGNVTRFKSALLSPLTLGCYYWGRRRRICNVRSRFCLPAFLLHLPPSEEKQRLHWKRMIWQRLPRSLHRRWRIALGSRPTALWGRRTVWVFPYWATHQPRRLRQTPAWSSPQSPWWPFLRPCRPVSCQGSRPERASCPKFTPPPGTPRWAPTGTTRRRLSSAFSG